MIEVEIKARLGKDIKLETFEQQLSKIGATYLKTINQTDIYFQHPKRDFKKTDEALRIRQEEKQSILTYKGPKLEERSKTREELEVEFKEKSKMEEILRKLGFWAVFEVKKTRKLFNLGEIKISIDKVENLGIFIELETETDSEDEVKSAVNLLINKSKMLGIKEESLERTSYLELLLEKFGVKK